MQHSSRSAVLCDFILKCGRCWAIDSVKDKKNKIKNNKNQTENNLQKNAKLAFEPRSLECKARIITTVVRYYMSTQQIYKTYVQISVLRMGDQR